MNLRSILIPAGGLVLIGFAYRSYGWGGVALAGGGIVMFLLLNFNRAIQVLKRTADRPVGYVASAVMLNAKLQQGSTLMHVIALTRALGELRSPQDSQPELFRWTDTGGSWVDTVFVDGKLREWTLTRPDAAPTPVSAPDQNGADSSTTS